LEDRAFEYTSAALICGIAIPSPMNRNTYFALFSPVAATSVFMAAASVLPPANTAMGMHSIAPRIAAAEIFSW